MEDGGKTLQGGEYPNQGGLALQISGGGGGLTLSGGGGKFSRGIRLPLPMFYLREFFNNIY